jgi:hypothetical protein
MQFAIHKESDEQAWQPNGWAVPQVAAETLHKQDGEEISDHPYERVQHEMARAETRASRK